VIVAEVGALSVLARRDPGRPLVDAISLQVRAGAVVGLVGETGAGKTLTTRAMTGLLPAGLTATGSIAIGGREPVDARRQRELRAVLGGDVGIVLQHPGGMFDPLFRLGDQLVEGVVATRRMPRSAARERALALLARMRFDDPAGVTRLFPHQLSGGMLQRAGIAMTLMPGPRLIVADEPTSALDAHVRLDVLELLTATAVEDGAGVLLISHDLGLVSRSCDAVHVLHRGRVVESGRTTDVLASPTHPYTRALLACAPTVASPPRERLPTFDARDLEEAAT
jgi:ABC-type glutathione transport system ATPase component